MENTDAKKKVLFICTHNAARSQMAEGLLRALYGNRYEAYSAGTKPTQVHPCAVEVMQEVGIDISSHRSKSLEEFEGQQFDYVVTVCAGEEETCPTFLGAAGHRVTWHINRAYLRQAFDDPAKAKEALSEADCLPFRTVRDQLKAWIEETFDTSE